MGSLRFVPAEGQWVLLAAWPTMVAVPAFLSDETIEAIWSVLSQPEVTLERVVSAIPLRGADAAASFSVVRLEPGGGSADAAQAREASGSPAHAPASGLDPDSAPGDSATWTATVVTRGSAVVDLLSVGGSRRFGSSGLEPWALAEFSDVIGVSLGASPSAPEAVLRIPPEARRLDRGIASASRVVWASTPILLTTGGPPAAPSPATASSSSASVDPFLAAPDDDTVITRTRPGSLDAETTEPPHPDRSIEPPAASTTIPETASETDPADPTTSEPPVPAISPTTPTIDPTPAPPTTPAFDLHINGGAPIALAGSVVVGRRPRPRRSPTALPQTLVQVNSPELRVSGTHVEIALSGRTVVVTDLRSSNGTTVLLPGRPPIRLRQGDSVVATGPAIVEIGDGNVIHISPRDRGNTGITV